MYLNPEHFFSLGALKIVLPVFVNVHVAVVSILLECKLFESVPMPDAF